MTAAVVALVTAALTFALASRYAGPPSLKKDGIILTAGTGFSITSTISSSSTSQSAALLYPSVQDYIWYTAHNPYKVPITVSSMSISSVSAPAACPATNLDTSHSAFSGTLTVPAGGSSSVAEPISLIDTHTNQNACEGAGFSFVFSGSATYVEVYGTSTVVASSLNPSPVGVSVTYTATVTANVTSSQDTPPNGPTGAVTFKDGSTVVCSAVPVTVGALTSTASCTSPVYATPATHPITASYVNSDGNFTSGISSTLNQMVVPATTSTVLVSSPTTSLFGQAVGLTATVTAVTGPTPTGSVNFYLGTSTGSNTLLGTSSLSNGKATLSTSALPPGSDSLYAVYTGSTTDNSSSSASISQTVTFSPASCVNGTTKGGYTVQSGQSVCITGRVNGGVTVQPGGSVFLNGAAINGAFTSTNATAIRICGSTITGNISITGTTGSLVIGDAGDDGPPGCAGNTLNGLVITIQSNHGGFEFSMNHALGALTFSGNAGAGPTVEDANPEVEGNTITGTLTCSSSNVPTITDGGIQNHLLGLSTGQCAGPNF